MVEILNRESRRVKRTLFMILVLDGFLIVLTSATCYFLATENSEFLSYHPFQQQCLPCRDLALHPDDVVEGIVKSNNDTSCCASQTENIPNLVDKFVEKWLKRYQAKKSPEYHGCKKSDSDQNKNNPKKEFFKIHGFEGQRLNATHHRRVHWDKNKAVKSENMEYWHGYVTVPQTGLYQIYSQIVADFEQDQHNNDLNIFMHQIAVKKHEGNNGEKSIIYSSQSQCEEDDDGAYIKSHIGTVYSFEEGDKVVVKASYPERIRPNSRMNFFGIHMI